MKKIAAGLQKLKDQQPSMFEIIYQQRVQSAAQFENVQYNISDILQFVSTVTQA